MGEIRARGREEGGTGEGSGRRGWNGPIRMECGIGVVGFMGPEGRVVHGRTGEVWRMRQGGGDGGRSGVGTSGWERGGRRLKGGEGEEGRRVGMDDKYRGSHSFVRRVEVLASAAS